MNSIDCDYDIIYTTSVNLCFTMFSDKIELWITRHPHIYFVKQFGVIAFKCSMSSYKQLCKSIDKLLTVIDAYILVDNLLPNLFKQKFIIEFN